VIALNAYIFDLGNVIIRTNTQPSYDVWAKYANQDLQRLAEIPFEFDEIYERFESGQISPEDYFQHWRERLGVEIAYHEFVEGWNSIYDGLIPEAISVARKLKQESRIVALTNTNGIHNAKWPTLYPEVINIFERIYKSNEIGLRKPEAECFNHVLAHEI
tara:strand:+ start:61 stop:540 length:480 start_codon:yes stop_codon:yes gene_type:complete